MRTHRRLTVFPKQDEHFRNIPIGRYGRDSWVLGLEYTRECHTFVDVGAHIGHYCWNAMGAFKRIYAFEPVPENFRCLRDNILNRGKTLKRKPKVYLYNAAVGDCLGSAKLKYADPSNGKNSGAWELSENGEGREIDTAILTLDDLKIDRVDLIKIDTQGWESRVLDGARETIERDKPALIVEVVNNHVLNDPLVKKVVGMGYRAYAITQKDMIFQPMRSGE